MFERIWIDGGGTNVRAIGDNGRRRTRLFQMPARAWSLETAVRRVRQRVVPGGEIVVGARGAWTPAEKSALKRRLPAGHARLRVVSDIEVAHALAFPDGVGIVLNAGTGSIAFGRNAAGKTARAGGLGPLLGDDGSAFWIGREYIRRVESRSTPFGKVRALAVGLNPVAAIAARAKVALKAARRGGEARTIVDEAHRALLTLVADVQRQLGGKKLPVALQGGLFKDAMFRRAFERQGGKRGN